MPGHGDIPGSCKADELARKGTLKHISDVFVNVGKPMATMKIGMDQDMMAIWRQRWRDSDQSCTARQG